MTDSYTKKTKAWLDRRFRESDRNGVYKAHNPIYGFLKNPDRVTCAENYSRVYQIMTALSKFRFKTLLDVGGAEGYYLFIARQIFGVKVRNCDLSLEACKRAKEIFGIESDFCDAHYLPYKNGQFDIVICSETLEHVKDQKRVIGELLRVAKKAVVVSVPVEPVAAVSYNIKKKVPHGHIHSFNIKSFDYLKDEGYKVIVKMINSVFINIPDGLIRAKNIGFYVGRYPRIFFDIYNKSLNLLRSRPMRKILRFIFSARGIDFLIRADSLVCKLTHLNHDEVAIVLEKEGRIIKSNKKIVPMDIINQKVPYHFLKKYENQL